MDKVTREQVIRVFTDALESTEDFGSAMKRQILASVNNLVIVNNETASIYVVDVGKIEIDLTQGPEVAATQFIAALKAMIN